MTVLTHWALAVRAQVFIIFWTAIAWTVRAFRAEPLSCGLPFTHQLVTCELVLFVDNAYGTGFVFFVELEAEIDLNKFGAVFVSIGSINNGHVTMSCHRRFRRIQAIKPHLGPAHEVKVVRIRIKKGLISPLPVSLYSPAVEDLISKENCQSDRD